MGNPFSGLRLRWPSTAPISVEDYRRIARRKLPQIVWAIIENGADDEVTLRANRNAFRQWTFRPKFLSGKEGTGLSTRIGDRPISLPVFLCPTGTSGLYRWEGEVAAAQAAERAGTLAVISTAASYTPEEIRAATNERHFFQLYCFSNPEAGRHDLSDSFISRAHDAGYEGLFVTVDVPTHGNREGERRHSLGSPPAFTPAQLLDAAMHPQWLMNYLVHQRITPRLLSAQGNLAGVAQAVSGPTKIFRPELDWNDFAHIREKWKKPLFIKGLLHPDDAAKAVELGADGIVISNHGGRQLDSSQSTLDALVGIVDRVGGKVPILLDGGIRRGTDVVKALCLGATAVGIGRPYLYGLAANGADGVAHVLEIFREEIARTLTLLGCQDVSELNPSMLARADILSATDAMEEIGMAGASSATRYEPSYR